MSKRAQYYLFPFSSFLPAPQQPPTAPPMLPSGRGLWEGVGVPAYSSEGALTSTFPLNRTPTGRAGGAPSPCMRHFVKALPSGSPTPSSPRAGSREGEDLCLPPEALTLAEGRKERWHFLVLLGGGPPQPPSKGTSEMATLYSSQTGPSLSSTPCRGSQGWGLSLVP